MRDELPFDEDAERGVLGSVLIDPKAFFLVTPWLRASDFYRQAHRLTYAAMEAFAADDRKIDPIALRDYLDMRGQLEDAGGASTLYSYDRYVPTSLHIIEYARIVRSKARLRQLLVASERFATLAMTAQDADEAVTQAHALLATLQGDGEDEGFHGFARILSDTMADVHERMDDPDKARIQTGIFALDQAIIGFDPGELVLLCGRPGTGKSITGAQFALNIARAFFSQGEGSVAYLTLEMPYKQVTRRLLANVAEVDSRIIRAGFRRPNGSIDEDAYQRVMVAHQALAPLDPYLYFRQTAATLSDLRASLAGEVAQHHCRVALIDQLDLIESENPRESERDRVSKISRGLKKMATDLNITVIALAQLNRETERGGNNAKPTLINLAESDRLGRDADWVIATWRDALGDRARAQQEPLFDQYAQMLILKGRDGDQDGQVDVRLERRYCRISDWPTYPPYSGWLAQYEEAERAKAAESRPRDMRVRRTAGADDD